MADADCVFCTIAAGGIPAEIVAESDAAIAFRDLSPEAPVHVLVIPRDHYANVAEVAAADDAVIAAMIRLAAEVAEIDGIAETGYRLVANTNADAHQTVFHAHLHLLGGRRMGWPPG